MKISVIVPVYNAEKYLNRLVQSVIEQTYDDFELILVDDQSRDDSFYLMQEYQSSDKRIKAYTKNNTGPGLTRKFGFEKSTGELVYFVDSDDWITTPTVLEEINTLFERNPTIDVLFFDREDIIGDKVEIIPGFEHVGEGVHDIEEISEVIRPGLGAKILKREILNVDMFYESTVFEDLYTTYAYLDECNKFYYSRKCYYTIYHEENSNSLSSKQSADSFEKSLRMILKIYQRTLQPSLKYSLELRMALILAVYWRNRVKNEHGYNSNEIRMKIRQIVQILKRNNIVIKPRSNKIFKTVAYNIMLFISGGKN